MMLALLLPGFAASPLTRAPAEVVGQDDACTVSAASHVQDACSVELMQRVTKRHMHLKAENERLGWAGIARDKLPARVAAVYTWGAPPASWRPLENLASEDGCFPGLRAYAENIMGQIHQVDPMAMSNPFNHTRIATLALHPGGEDSYYVDCNGTLQGEPTWPLRTGQVYEHIQFRVNAENTYKAYSTRLSDVFVDGVNVSAQDPFKSSRYFLPLAFAVYESNDTVKELLAEKLPEWRLVASEVYNASKRDKDPVMLFQNIHDLNCALVFAGKNSESEFTLSYLPVVFCGFTRVLTAYQHEISNVTSNLWPNIGWKLGKCSRLVCVGEGVGGAVCDLFAACLNSGRVDNSDYLKLSWSPTDAELLPEV